MNKMIKILLLQSIKNNREKMKFFKTIAAAVAISVSVTSFAQSNDFKLGQYGDSVFDTERALQILC